MPLNVRIAVVTTWEKIFFPTKRFLDQSPKKVWEIIYFSKIVFPKNFHGNIDCGFRNSGESFRWK